ncbi:12750_t:CDS:2 [Dentiscutata heterogama]|uniref:12750_t:CDS:1 n=1 Tax=Dentiscutata heterogama TaxID=1316150 RepID=A0ACA9LKK9_9GLOM|nr:12750_t:CDS:2 [Dentiscutata heterogama]
MAYWISNKLNKIRDNLPHRHPKLPDFHLADESLPFQIGKKISVKEYNDFLDRNKSSGYKFHFDKKNVYIIEIAYTPHEDVISYLQDCFKEPNNRLKLGPIIVSGQPSQPGGVLSSNITLAGNGIYVKEWECGTIHHNTHAPTGCGVPNVEDYTAVVPDTVGENFVIDLYDIQQIVLNLN